MSESTDLIRRLRRVRQTRDFTDTPVTAEHLAAILEVARWTGSARNVQPWEFMVIDDRADLLWLSELSPSSGYFDRAPLVIIPLVDAASPTPELDRGRLIERLFTAAAALDLGAGIGGFPARVRQDVADRFGIPDPASLYGGIAIGTPQPRPTGRSGNAARKPLAELVHYGRYGTHTRTTTGTGTAS